MTLTRTYNDPAKQLARQKLKEFIARHYSEKRRKDLKVLCFPGAEAEGEEALEVREVYDKVIVPNNPSARPKNSFLSEFRTLTDQIKKHNKDIKNSKI